MKIRVQHKGGSVEVITLVPPVVELRDGEHLSSFKCGDDTEFYFTPDGFYDGWGRPVNCSLDEAKAEIERMREGSEQEDHEQ